jgi:hypothetical protein
MSNLPESRAFLVQLSDQTDSAADVPTGRVEHIDSGRRARFSSREELWIFIETMLAQEASGEGEES